VTIRDQDTTEQIRIPLDEVMAYLGRRLMDTRDRVCVCLRERVEYKVSTTVVQIINGANHYILLRLYVISIQNNHYYYCVCCFTIKFTIASHALVFY
jgi:hypothetical protein